MIGPLITSFLQGKVNPTMTSITSKAYAEPATDASKTEYFKGSLGEVLDTSRRWLKTVGGRVLRTMNDWLPYRARPIKARRRRTRIGHTLGVEIYTFRMVWRSHHWPRIKKRLKELQFNRKYWWK